MEGRCRAKRQLPCQSPLSRISLNEKGPRKKNYYVYLLDAELSKKYGVPASKFCEQDFRGRTRVKGTSTKDQILLWHRMELINQQQWLQEHRDIFELIIAEKPLSQQINCNNWIEELDDDDDDDSQRIQLPDDSRAFSAASAALMAASSTTNHNNSVCCGPSTTTFNRISVRSG